MKPDPVVLEPQWVGFQILYDNIKYNVKSK